jgi:hypothetical protein
MRSVVIGVSPRGGIISFSATIYREGGLINWNLRERPPADTAHTE